MNTLYNVRFQWVSHLEAYLVLAQNLSIPNSITKTKIRYPLPSQLM